MNNSSQSQHHFLPRTELNQTTMEAAENDSVVLETTEPSSSHGSDGDDHLRQSSDVLAKGLSSMLSSVISDFDFRAQQTLQSQNHLSSVIDRLTGGFSFGFSVFFFTNFTTLLNFQHFQLLKLDSICM